MPLQCVLSPGSWAGIACKEIATCSYSGRKVAPMLSVRTDTMGFQKAKGAVWLLGLFGVLWVVAGWIALGASKQVMLGGIALIVLAITLRILNNWRCRPASLAWRRQARSSRPLPKE